MGLLLACQCRKLRNPGSIPGMGRSPGESKGNPLQYSCLESPTDRGDWRATVHRVAKSWTWLKRLCTAHIAWTSAPKSIHPSTNCPHIDSVQPSGEMWQGRNSAQCCFLCFCKQCLFQLLLNVQIIVAKVIWGLERDCSPVVGVEKWKWKC